MRFYLLLETNETIFIGDNTIIASAKLEYVMYTATIVECSRLFMNYINKEEIKSIYEIRLCTR